MTRLDNKHVLRIGSGTAFIHLVLDPTRQIITGIISNPNRFKTWQTYLNFMESILPQSSLQTAKITRLDLNIDFNMPFNLLIQQIDIKNKSTGTHYEDKKGDRTGIYIGKGSEILVIYDKGKKDNLSSTHSRVELRLSGRKLPTHSLYNLPQLLRDKAFFHNIEGVHIVSASALLSEGQKHKAEEFQSILQRDGLYAARKALGRNRNFDRDVAKAFKISPWPIHPSEIFKRGLQSFLGYNQEPDCLIH